MSDNALLAILLSIVIFIALVENLAMKPSFSAKLTTLLMTISVIGGHIVYGAGYAEVLGDIRLAVIRTPFSVIGMFLGKNDLSAIAGSSVVSSDTGLVIFWLLHLMAFYTMASAAMITIGAEALRQLRFLLAGRGNLVIVFGKNSSSVDIGRKCLERGGCSVIFVTESMPVAQINEINNMGMSVMTGKEAVRSAPGAVKKLRIKGRKITVFALDPETDRNLFYALNLKNALEKAQVPPQNTYITLPGADDIIAPMLQVSDTSYGFGYVNVYEEPVLAARTLIRMCPPWELISFGEDGRAAEDFSCVIVGFGRFGQEALKQLVMNAQFAGNTFHAAVFSPRYNSEAGYLFADSPELMQKYDIKGFQADARSKEFYEYIGNRLSIIKMIAVCTGDVEMNSEIADNLMLYLKRRNAEQIAVIQCGKNGVRYQETVGAPIRSTPLYTLRMLSAEDADKEAIVLNSTYDTSDRTDWEKWVACSAFGKISSRASADFMPAFIRAAGKKPEDVKNGDWELSQEMQQVLGETEHLRWCAFHYAMGYSLLDDEEFERRAAEYRKCREEGTEYPKRVTKDPEARLHACLIPWDELDVLSEKESELTGKKVDYKQIDINNVLALPNVLSASGKAEIHR